MNEYQCFCPICNKAFKYLMQHDEFRMMATLTKKTLDEFGRLILACDDCHPMKYSKPIVRAS